MLRVLRTGGVLFLGVPNRYWYGRLRADEPRARGSRGVGPWFPRRLRAAGFEAVRAYFVGPGLADPREIVPARRSAVKVIQGIRREDWGNRYDRANIFALAPLSNLLFPAKVLVARA
jgi:hypothetical protein